MKYKATKKAVRAGYLHIIGIGYGNAQSLLHFHNPIAYSAGVYGWACDYYAFGGTVISTGYSPLASVNATVRYERVRWYDDQARAIIAQYDMPYDQRKADVEALLEAFLEECITGGSK